MDVNQEAQSASADMRASTEDAQAYVGRTVRSIEWCDRRDDDPDAGYVVISFTDGSSIWGDSPSFYGSER